MAINLGNVAGVVRGLNPPVEEDGITEKRYVLWAKITSEDPLQYEVHYFNLNVNQWLSIESLQNTLTNVLSFIGDLTTLDTTVKNNLVLSINEVLNKVNDIIDDTSPSSITTYSSLKVEQLLSTLSDNIIDNADPDFNTLSKLQEKIENITLDNSGSVRFDIVQSLSTVEKNTAANNIGVFTKEEIGDVSENLLNYYNSL